MASSAMTGRAVGALFLTVMGAYMVGIALIDPILATPDYLTTITTSRAPIVTGVFMELINGLAYVGIAVLMFPIIKRHHQSVALAYLTIRLMEFAMQIVSDLGPLMLLTLSQEFVDAGAPADSPLLAVGSGALALRYWSSQMVFLAYAVSAPFFYFAAYRLRLFPRFLAIWGLVGAPVVAISVVLEMYGFEPWLLIGAQMGLNEIALGIWLVVKGFNPTSLNR